MSHSILTESNSFHSHNTSIQNQERSMSMMQFSRIADGNESSAPASRNVVASGHHRPSDLYGSS